MGAQAVGYPVASEALPVATLDRERLISESTYGRALLDALASRQAALVEENARLAADLEAEELALTKARKTMAPEEFRPLAEAFHAKANRIRAEQEAKAVALARDLESARQRFFREIEPVLLRLMNEEGVLILLNASAVIYAVDAADLTDRVLAVLNRMHAEGELGQE